MDRWRQQQGMSFWGLVFFLSVLAFALFIGFKLFPPYMEDFKVRSALDSLARQPDISTMTRADISTALEKRFDIDNIDAVKLAKDLTVETRGRLKVIRIRYENVIPIAGNLSILLEFDHVKEVRSGE
jgi:hypothetical protein